MKPTKHTREAIQMAALLLRVRTASLLFALTAILVSPGLAQTTTLRMQLPPSANPAAAEAATRMALNIDRATAGAVKLEMLPAGSIVPSGSVLGALQAGTLDLGFIVTSNLEQLDKRFQVFKTPFLFEDVGAVNRFQKSSSGQELLRDLATQKVVPLAYWHGSMQVIASSTKPILKPDDLKGQKIGVPTFSTVEASAFKQFGATPVLMSASELRSAVTQGQIGSAAASPFSISEFGGSTKALTVTNHSYYGFVLAGSDRLNQLKPSELVALRGAVASATTFANRAAAEAISASLQGIEGKGTSVSSLSGAQRSAWQKSAAVEWADVRKSAGPTLFEAAVTAAGTDGGGDPCQIGTCRCKNRECKLSCCDE